MALVIVHKISVHKRSYTLPSGSCSIDEWNYHGSCRFWPILRLLSGPAPSVASSWDFSFNGEV